MTLPKSRGEILWTTFFSLIVVGSTFLALFNLANSVGIIISVIWLLIVGWILGNECREAGGLRRYLIAWLAAFAGRRFALFASDDAHQASIRFGYEIFGHRFYQNDVEIKRIESVEWSSGQATSMAGRDMEDWSVALWYDHCNPERSKQRHMLRKPEQDLYIVGPSRRKEDTVPFGMEFVSFLSSVGAFLIRGEGENVYIREAMNTKSIQQDAPSNGG